LRDIVIAVVQTASSVVSGICTVAESGGPVEEATISLYLHGHSRGSFGFQSKRYKGRFIIGVKLEIVVASTSCSLADSNKLWNFDP